MESVFISYRRSDSLDLARRLTSALRSYFGERTVFLDEGSALPGQQWPKRIAEALISSRIALVLIGENWLAAQDATSRRRRIDMEDDWVRQEILQCLRRKAENEPFDLLPVLIDNATMPSAEQLGDALAPLSHYQAVRIQSSGRPHDFDDLKDRLVQLRLPPRVLPPVNTPRIGKIPEQLTLEEERKFIARFPLWEIADSTEAGVPGGFKRELHRTYEFKSFEGAFDFMCEIKRRAIDPWDHHPRWENSYNRVEVWLTTFNLGHKPSYKDLRLATEFELIWREYKKGRR